MMCCDAEDHNTATLKYFPRKYIYTVLTKKKRANNGTFTEIGKSTTATSYSGSAHFDK